MTSTRPAPTPTTTDEQPPTYHFVCCDQAYCCAPVEDEAPTDLTTDDRPCNECTNLALKASCPECGLLFP